MNRTALRCGLGIALLYTVVACSGHGDSGPPPARSCTAPPQGPHSSASLTLAPAFPNLPNLGAVVAIRQAPGDTSRWYAALQDGRVVSFDNNPSVDSISEFLNIQSQVVFNGEQGLLGMAFHPDYANNGEIYLYYSTGTPTRRSNISRFTFVNGIWQEDILLSVQQPYANHNGGNILFGPDDGYLYIGLGDGGGGGDPDRNGQDPSTLLGSMLRIDVDNGVPYAIPADNPYAGNPLCDNPDVVSHALWCPEIYAYGLRNPWRWSFDRVTQQLWLGDVGQNRVEEIDLIDNGENYGWVVMEGSECYGGGTTCNAAGDYTLPVAEYSHDGGSASVVGGYVYRGNDPVLASLYGSYLFADTYSGRIYQTSSDGTQYTTRPLLESGLTIYSFSESADGELFILSPSGATGSGGNIFKFVSASDPLPASPIATMLSETGCFTSTRPLTPAAGVIPYTVIQPLWSDGALKQRWFTIPEGSQIDLTDDGDFIFPAGSVLIKHFLLNGKPIETRLLMRHNDYWGGYSYEWLYDSNGNAVDAQLLNEAKSKSIDGQQWLYPGRTQCFNCHTSAAHIALGLETLQLNREFTDPAGGQAANQLDTLQARGLFSTALTPQQRESRLYALDEDQASFQLRAKSYLHSNCSQCHRTGGSTPSAMDLRFTTALADMHVCDVDPQGGDLGISGLKLLDPAGTLLQPNSAIIARMESLDSTVRMPPLASDVVDSSAVSVLKYWVDGLNGCL